MNKDKSIFKNMQSFQGNKNKLKIKFWSFYQVLKVIFLMMKH